MVTMSKSKKILVITYYWPPCGGAGVQRWLKFTKYMPDFGWEPYVLTVDPRYASYPALDESFNKEIRDPEKVFRTRARNYFRFNRGTVSSGTGTVGPSTLNKSLSGSLARFIRGNFFIPDPRKGWNKYAVKKASELIIKEGIQYIVTTSPPHSTQLIGLKLKKLFPSVKWIADLRDPWTDIYYYDKFMGTWPAKTYDRSLEKRVLDRSDRIITVGRILAGHFAGKLKNNQQKISVVSNGYDENDFKSLQKSKPDMLTITYVGSLTEQYPSNSLIASLRQLNEKDIGYKFRFVGDCSPGIKRKIKSVVQEDSFYYLSYRSHREALTAMLTSSVLLVIIPDHEENRMIITGKLFEYLRTGIPILCIGPKNGEAAQIIKECGAGATFGKEDTEGITDYLLSGLIDKTKYEIPEQYSRKNLTEILTGEIEKL